MNRREFLKRMALAGLVLPSTRTIIDMGANLWKRQPEMIPGDLVIKSYLTGPEVIYFKGKPLRGGAIDDGVLCLMVYDGSRFHMVTEPHAQ